MDSAQYHHLIYQNLLRSYTVTPELSEINNNEVVGRIGIEPITY